jgi:RNA polymerase sigma-70 factor (ECF subfamily)
MQAATARGFDPVKAQRAELADVVARLHPRMIATAARVLRDDDAAEDAVQDAYLQALSHLDQFDGRARLSTWLHRIVVNAALMRLRTRRRRPTEPDDGVVLVDDSADVEATVVRRQAQAVVRRSLDGVATRHRMLLVLRDLQGREPKQIARALGVTCGALKVRTYRARRALRAQLLRIGVDDDGAPPLRAVS